MQYMIDSFTYTQFDKHVVYNMKCKVPPDLRKIDRIMHSLAEVWWRQHDRKDGPHAVLRSEGKLSLVIM